MDDKYTALTIESLPQRLGVVSAITDQIGVEIRKWEVKEVGDGNLNLVFIVIGDKGKIIIKQALPHMRLVGEGWPLTLERSFFEYNALIRQEKSDPGIIPEVYYFNKTQGLIAMEFLEYHKILRVKLINGEKVEGLSNSLGKHCARLAFRGSELSMDSSEKKADSALFYRNVELMGITQNFVFTDPYYKAELNFNTDGLAPIIKILRQDTKLKTQAHKMLMRFSSHGETLCHGDLHTGSIMCTYNDTKVIDPEFAIYGPMGFDLGMLIANYLMSFFSQPAHRLNSIETSAFQSWLLKIIEDTVEKFSTEFRSLWNKERKGILYSKSLFEDQGQSSKYALDSVMSDIWKNSLSFCGIEMLRRCLSLAHNADFEKIEDTIMRAKLEARNLMMGRELLLNPNSIKGVKSLINMAKEFNRKDFL
tara:strand:- start:900 stop:2159 length:1260 start_codon:yes stop_codon:yes gene_type:complete